MCQCELGAVWANTMEHIPILVPPLTTKDLEYILRNHQSMRITDKDKLNSLNDQITEWMGIKPNKASIWQMKCDKFLADMENIITKVCNVVYEKEFFVINCINCMKKFQIYYRKKIN